MSFSGQIFTEFFLSVLIFVEVRQKQQTLYMKMYINICDSSFQWSHMCFL